MHEFAEWQAIYHYIEPFGDRRGDLQAALIACEIGNRNLGTKEQVHPLSDYLLRFNPKPQKTEAELRQAAHEMVAAMRAGGNSRLQPPPTASLTASLTPDEFSI